MFGVKKDKNKSNLVETHLAIDIGTVNVKVALFVEEQSEIKVIGYSRIPQKPESMNSALILDIKKVADVVDFAIGEAVSQAEETFENIALPKKAYLGIAGELVQGVSIIVNVDREDPEELITLKEVEHVVDKVKAHTFSSTKDEIAEEIGLKPSQIDEIDSVINSISIDGKKVTSPIKMSGAGLTYRVFASYAPRVHLDSIKKIADELSLQVQRIVVEPYALAVGVESLTNLDANAIVIDVGGGTTDIALIKNGELIGTKMFAIGGNSFTHRIQKDKNLTYEQAEQLKLKYSTGGLKDFEKKEINRIVSKDIPLWLEGVQISLSEFDETSEFPPQFYICGGGSQLPEIMEGLISYPWIQSLNFKKHPKIDFLYPNKVKDVTDLTKTATDIMDVTPMALARIHLDY